MIDQFQYPQGDIQTWDESIGDRVITPPPSVEGLVSAANGLLHAFLWEPSPRQMMAERASYIGGMSFDPARLDITNRRQTRLRDKLSGLSYLAQPRLTMDPNELPDEDWHLLWAAAVRTHLAPGTEMFADTLAAPVVDYQASTREELRAVLDEIRQKLSGLPHFRRLWLRGQRIEYPAATHNASILDALHFGSAGKSFPSLVPSLGRFAQKNPGKVDIGYAFAGPSHWWKKPFLTWVIKSNPIWLDHYPEFRDRVEAGLRDPDDMTFTKILMDIQLDPRVPTEVDDLRQWFFAFYKYSAWIWVLQHYGYLASMLDVTSDLDSALFFTQARMIEGRFSLPDPEDGRVIYVFAEGRGPSTFRSSDEIDWGDADWARQLPARVTAQRAGCIMGSTWFRQNYYGHLVVARVWIGGKDCQTSLRIEDMFPPPENDLLLQTLLDAHPSPEGLYW